MFAWCSRGFKIGTDGPNSRCLREIARGARKLRQWDFWFLIFFELAANALCSSPLSAYSSLTLFNIQVVFKCLISTNRSRRLRSQYISQEATILDRWPRLIEVLSDKEVRLTRNTPFRRFLVFNFEYLSRRDPLFVDFKMHPFPFSTSPTTSFESGRRLPRVCATKKKNKSLLAFRGTW